MLWKIPSNFCYLGFQLFGSVVSARCLCRCHAEHSGEPSSHCAVLEVLPGRRAERISVPCAGGRAVCSQPRRSASPPPPCCLPAALRALFVRVPLAHSNRRGQM